MPETRMVRYCGNISKWLCLFLTFFAPQKFSSFVSTPEAVPFYRFDLISLVYIVWPITTFEIAASVLLFFSGIYYYFRHERRMEIQKHFLCWIMAWFVLFLVSLIGYVNCSAFVYADQMFAYFGGIVAYAVSLALILQDRPEFRRNLSYALLIGSFFAIYSGLHQYFIGFQELRDYIVKLEEESGRILVNHREFKGRLREARIQGNFASCNVYAIYLMALLPLCSVLAWRFGDEKVSPPVLSRRLFLGVVLGFFCYTIYLVQSRSAYLSCMLGCFFFWLCTPIAKKKKYIAIFLFVLCGILFFCFVFFTGRGGKSTLVRFDYWQASLKMFWEHPFFGTGWGDFFHDYLIHRIWLDREAPHTPHNMILLFLSQCGILGGFTAFFILLQSLYHGARMVFREFANKKTNEGKTRLALSLALLIAVFGMQFDLGFETPAYCGLLIVLSSMVMSFDITRKINFSKLNGFLISFVFFLFIFSTLYLGVRQFRREYAAAKLMEELDVSYSFKPNHIPSEDLVKTRLKKASDLDPHNPFLWVSGADSMIHLGYGNLAMDWLEEGIRRSPLRPSFYLKRARYRYFLNGNQMSEECKNDLKKARSLSPKNPDYDIPDEELISFEKEINLIM